MRKAERLFQILNLLRNRRQVLTAKQIASELEVSERTIYRDIQSLSLSGVPIEGEAGVGYRLQRQFDLPPLMFDSDEVEALLLGARMMKAWSDKQLAGSAASAMQKILSVLPEHLRHLENDQRIQVPVFSTMSAATTHSDTLRRAIKSKNQIRIDYVRADGQASQRTIYPLGVVYWGRTWTVIAWCELRKDFREFRFDRIVDLEVLDVHFVEDEKISLDRYLYLVKQEFENCEHDVFK